MEKLLQKSFIEELRNDGTYNDASFSREFERIELIKLLGIAEIALSFINYNIKMKNA